MPGLVVGAGDSAVSQTSSHHGGIRALYPGFCVQTVESDSCGFNPGSATSPLWTCV